MAMAASRRGDLDVLLSVREPRLIEDAVEVALLLVGVDAVATSATRDVALFLGGARQEIINLA